MNSTMLNILHIILRHHFLANSFVARTHKFPTRIQDARCWEDSTFVSSPKIEHRFAFDGPFSHVHLCLFMHLVLCVATQPPLASSWLARMPCRRLAGTKDGSHRYIRIKVYIPLPICQCYSVLTGGRCCSSCIRPTLDDYLLFDRCLHTNA